MSPRLSLRASIDNDRPTTDASAPLPFSLFPTHPLTSKGATQCSVASDMTTAELGHALFDSLNSHSHAIVSNLRSQLSAVRSGPQHIERLEGEKIDRVRALSSPWEKQKFEVDHELLPSRRGWWLMRKRRGRVCGRVQSVESTRKSHVEELNLREARLHATQRGRARRGEARRRSHAHTRHRFASLPHFPHLHPPVPKHISLRPTTIFSPTNENLQPHSSHLCAVTLDI